MRLVDRIMLGSTVLLMLGAPTIAQMGGMHGREGKGGMHGRGGMGGHCPMCGRQWDGKNYYAPSISDSLLKPSNKKWMQRLEDVLSDERLSLSQYQSDVEKHRLHMPYSMVIPQEDNHIAWISDLYKAFGIEVPETEESLKETGSADDALRLGMSLEEKLIPQYEWLIENTENESIKQLLGDILYQTRMHHTMFQHALSMGGMMR